MQLALEITGCNQLDLINEESIGNNREVDKITSRRARVTRTSTKRHVPPPPVQNSTAVQLYSNNDINRLNAWLTLKSNKEEQMRRCPADALMLAQTVWLGSVHCARVALTAPDGLEQRVQSRGFYWKSSFWRHHVSYLLPRLSKQHVVTNFMSSVSEWDLLPSTRLKQHTQQLWSGQDMLHGKERGVPCHQATTLSSLFKPLSVCHDLALFLAVNSWHDLTRCAYFNLPTGSSLFTPQGYWSTAGFFSSSVQSTVVFLLTPSVIKGSPIKFISCPSTRKKKVIWSWKS